MPWWPDDVWQAMRRGEGPHLHCHVLPQYRDDDPRANPDINAGELLLGREQQAARARLLAERLEHDPAAETFETS